MDGAIGIIIFVTLAIIAAFAMFQNSRQKSNINDINIRNDIDKDITSGMNEGVGIKYIPSLPVTTGLEIPGRPTIDVVDIITAEAAIGMNIIKDMGTAWRDFLGGRGGAVQDALREARKLCLAELRAEAARVGADAVIAVDLDYSNMSSNLVSGGMIFVVASGTAVKLAPKE